MNFIYQMQTTDKEISAVAETEEIIELNPELWKKIIDGGSYTVKIYKKHLRNNHSIDVYEKLMIAAIIEIEDLKGMSSSYSTT